MKYRLYAEENGGILYAVPNRFTEDVTENGWLFTEYKNGSDIENDVFSVQFSERGMLLIPKSFGSEKFIIDENEINIEILPVKPDSYRYKNLTIKGGGYVTGFTADDDGYIYCRTDIGGCYSSAPPHSEWKPLSHNADIDTCWLCYPLAITTKDNILYVLFGDNGKSFVGISSDKGKSFSFIPFPYPVHGNCTGRSTGERIAVTYDRIYVGTRGNGLSYIPRNTNNDEWVKLSIPYSGGGKLRIGRVFRHPPEEFLPNEDITFVKAVGNETIIAGTADNESVVVSYDSGKTFTALPDQPKPTPDNIPYTAQRCVVYGKYLFITYGASYDNREIPWFSYACDKSMIRKGAVLRYEIKDGRYVFSKDITPPHNRGGFSGISISSDGEYLACTSVCGSPDCVYLSKDMGESWEEVLTDKERATQDFHTPYLIHENNNNHSVIHWTSDILIDPRDKNTAYINTGTGIFRTKSLGVNHTVWDDYCEGVEETVHLAIYSPPAGDVRVIDITGDLGGFSFTDIDEECDFTFRDENNNRYITAINADFAEKDPRIAVCSPRGNWIGTSKGGAAISYDGGITWKHMTDPRGLNSRTDELLDRIARPNVNSGFVAISADGKNIIRQVADHQRLFAECSAVTDNTGESWHSIGFYDETNNEIKESEFRVKIFSDRINADIFYGFSNSGEVFLSRDKGFTFTRKKVCGAFPEVDFSVIEGREAGDIRVSPFEQGKILISFRNYGLFTLTLDNDEFISERVIPENECPCAVCGGYGKGGVIFFCGRYNGEYGFFRSLGNRFIRINTPETQFGHIRSLCGDPRAYGRFYLATGSFGSVYGEIELPTT